jgi:hypothetical protein
MATFNVTIRGVPLELGSLEGHVVAKDFFHRVIEAGSGSEAARKAVRDLSPKTAPVLVYVRDSDSALTVCWPTGAPVEYERRDVDEKSDSECFLMVEPRECVLRGAPEGESAVFAVGAYPGWICDPCAALVAPGI